MILWSLNYNDNSTVPTIFYKMVNININDVIEKKLEEEIFRIFYLTHRDAKSKIKAIKNNEENTYKHLYELLFPPKKVKNKFEYLVYLLNVFTIEIEKMGIL